MPEGDWPTPWFKSPPWSLRQATKLDWNPKDLETWLDSRFLSTWLFAASIVVFIAYHVLALYMTSIWLQAINGTKRIFQTLTVIFVLAAWGSQAPIILMDSDPRLALEIKSIAYMFQFIALSVFLFIIVTRKVRVVDIQDAVKTYITEPTNLSNLSDRELATLVRQAASMHLDRKTGEWENSG